MSLRVVVEVWCEIDPTLHVRIDRQTDMPQAEPGDRLHRVSLLGRAHVAAALGLEDGTVTAFALGEGHAEALRHALAAGATRAIELRSEGATVSTATLADWLRAQGADLVIADRLAGLVAARLGWAHLAGLDELQVADGYLHAVRCLGRGDREVVRARLPAAVRLQEESLRVPYVCRSRIQTLAEQPMEVHPLAGPATPSLETGPLQQARVRTRLGATPASAASASDRLQALLSGGGRSPAVVVRRPEKTVASPDQLADEFVRYLVHHGLLRD